ncbi:antiviral reverse transcriptase Drt3b [Acinetobacter baumannii]|uniref:antiviral reverse transcriptase Drt3b n=1 Tax=Acinetobacter baumannii TaxID=470 RepID=UPI00247A9E82|nr:antiviral reverse transcriptase Drt3b [Acinetobacter baumannii]MDK2172312.1 RNA-directed DNA polymerase [Acinetobacter baumannii]MDK2183132.1 RNA-directed DNA polymerase [Acinetobacter baumannii]MDK2329075.1 RNA-directed DNA polymerase [Acinetobacter baumannii]WGQ06597.1 RNA-directed DNA polymerase [Acinetobacter baumannii]
MKSKIYLDKKDFYRVLLTDVLPYEVPFILSNEGFYRNLKSNSFHSVTKKILELTLFTSQVNTNPFNFKISKDDSNFRKLYLVHPSSQIKISNLYKNYYQLITHLCSRSSFSLRYPTYVAKAFYSIESDRSNSENYKDEDIELLSQKSPKYASTYFVYKDISFLYKFYDSYRFHRIEKKFNKLLKFDIAKCFDSISTFQLPRSVNKNCSFESHTDIHSFEHLFSSIMKGAYHGNTHGIVIGPEFSRIFAEILLQSIDVAIKNKLRNEMGIKEGVDYVIKRYVDDYFLFYNNEQTSNLIFECIVEELSKYRLFCNESKSIRTTIPFITGITIAKHEIRKRLETFFELFESINNKDDYIGLKLNHYYKISNQLISDIKCIVFNNNVSYSSISGYFFTLMKNHVLHIKDSFSFEDKSKVENLSKLFLIILDVSFFVYCMNFKVRSTYLISQIIVLISTIAESFDLNLIDLINKKIYDEVDLVLKIKSNSNLLNNIEILNLLIAVRDIDLNYQILVDDLMLLFSSERINKYNYFSLMTFLFYVQRKKQYQPIRDRIYAIIIQKFNQNNLNVSNDSELIHIFFDSLSCPYLTKNQKINITNSALNSILKLNDNEIDVFVEEMSKTNWFIDWNLQTKDAIQRLLMKKELKSPYEN